MQPTEEEGEKEEEKKEEDKADVNWVLTTKNTAAKRRALCSTLKLMGTVVRESK